MTLEKNVPIPYSSSTTHEEEPSKRDELYSVSLTASSVTLSILPPPGKNFRRQEALMPSHTQPRIYEIPVKFVQRRLAAPGRVYSH
jgi:hypothetical protein